MILLALNELNIEFIKGYIGEGKLKNFSRLLGNGIVETRSETSYELLEPWIQWVTVHTGKSFLEHQVFRLGDIIHNKELTQLFEYLEALGLSIGAISPFNADNRMRNPKFFIPDPWTQTTPSGGFLIRKLSRSISRFVNSNASGNVKILDVLWLFVGFLVYVRVKRWGNFLKKLLILKMPGVKAAVLDMILLEVFVTLHKSKKPNYSHLFLNGGAHVQHHYMYNSSQYDGNSRNPYWYCPPDYDPILMMLETYDLIIGDLLESGERIVGVTGLHQVAHEGVTFYWRPKVHREFLRECGLNVKFNVVPRMSRDFLIEVTDSSIALEIESHLKQFTDSVRSKPVFNIDNRGTSLFVEIIYNEDLHKGLSFDGPNGISVEATKLNLAFVAIKNGKHHDKGYVFSNFPMDLAKEIKLIELNGFIIQSALSDFQKSKNDKFENNSSHS